ncbi:DUF2130 domain-containing protein [Rhodomicrobium vannielii ATCC 17100]|uniref:DUF2130 domain-containing protein n=1 Tax=Rhodomicrobium vannielii TaxID=1069 RepID=UPI001918AA28|nr:DUF2130 domain-containing protein [Rhodomicrobium vannielii]MBJ7532727.1 DUF2130 domain-containing protein [Rhodomicrobium vannielii ATCC 17100]
MTGQTITCPNCRTAFKLDESLAAPLLEATRKEYEHKLTAKDAAIAEREAKIKAEQDALTRRQAELDEQVTAKVNAEKAKIAAEEGRKAKLLLENDLSQKDKALADLNEVLKARDAKLAEAQQQQAELLKLQRQLEDEKRELAVTVEKKVQESLTPLRQKAVAEAEERYRLQIAERDEEKASLQRKVEDLQKKLQQGSQQLQGEVLEMELEGLLRARFAHDAIEPVGKGEFGGDVVQRVMTPAGLACGTILWESKRTKNWSDGWLTKLREDQRNAKADVALIVSNALPKGVSTFDLVDGVWVADVRCAIPVAVCLRQSLIELATARRTADGQLTKAEMTYRYLTGPRFRQRIEAIVERFREMQADLHRERSQAIRQFAKRENQLHGMLDATVGMYGDLQGIAGSALADIESLEQPMIESKTAVS